jgi:hypothetical protein
MPQQTLFRLTTIVLLCLLFTPTNLRAQLFGTSENDPRWGDWKSAPNFPGIEIRVACGTYVPSSGDTQWSFQFRNAYSKKVYLVYEEEAGDSTGSPPKFSAPGARNLDAGQKSDIYTAYLRGTCEARKQIFIRVVSISDDQGHQTQAHKGTSRSGAFESAAPSSSSSTSARTTGGLTTPGSSGKTQAPGTTSQPSSSGQGQLSQTDSDSHASVSVSGSTWSCNSTLYDHFRGTSYPLERQDYSYLITFHPNGSVSTQNLPYGGFQGRWRQDGTVLKWTDTGTVESGEGEKYANGAQQLFVMNLSGNQMRGGVHFLIQEPPDTHIDLQCQLSPNK